MNLKAIVSGAIQSVLPDETLRLRRSTGNTTDAAGKVSPSYASPLPVQGNVQSLSYKDLMQIDGLNLQGTRRKIYLFGHVDGQVRVFSKGGDLITDAGGQVWLVAQNLEQWPDWCAVAATLQDGT